MSAPLRWLQLIPGRRIDPESAVSLVLSLVNNRSLGELIFETETKGGVSDPRFFIGTTKPTAVAKAVASFMPGSRARPVERANSVWPTSWSVQSSTSLQGLQVDRGTDVSRRLLQVLASSPRALIHRVIVGRRLPSHRVASNLKSAPAESWAQQARDAVLGPRPLDSSQTRDLIAKQALAGAEVSIQLVAPAPASLQRINTYDAASSGEHEGISFGELIDQRHAHRAALPLSGYLAALRALESPGLRLRLRPNQGLGSWFRLRPYLKLNAAEIVAALGWPLGEDDYPGVDRSKPLVLPYLGPAAPERVIGEAIEPARKPVGLPLRDYLRHLHLLGPTGAGKSTVLLHLALQDIAAGHGLVVVDPKGDLVDDILTSVPQSSRTRLVLLDPSRTDFSVGFNPLDVPLGDQELAVDGVSHIFSSIYKDNWGPRTADIFHSACLTLAGTPYASLSHIPRLLGDEAFRRQVLASKPISSPLASFWSWFNQISSAERFAATAPLMNKLRPFLLRSGIRSMLAQTGNAFDPKMIFERQAVLLVPLRKGRLGPVAAQTLGSLVMSRLWLETLAQSKLPATQRRPLVMILDEFQEYVRLDVDFTDVLAQARGLGVGLALAHQHLGQLSPSVRSAVAGNAASKVFFRLGSEDAAIAARTIPELETADLAGLGSFQAYAQTLRGGELQPWASIRTQPPPPRGRASAEAIARELARKWGRPIAEVEERERATPDVSGTTVIGRKTEASS